MKKVIVLLAISVIMISCSHLILYEDDPPIKTTGKYMARIPLAVGTLLLSEYVMADITKNHNRKVISQAWQRYSATTDPIEKERLRKEIQRAEILIQIDKNIKGIN